MTITLIPKSDDDSDRQMPIFHEHTSDFDEWWRKSGFADVDKLIFFRRPKKRVRFDEAKNEIWTIDRYDDKENDKLIFFQCPKKRVRFDESKNEIWTIDRYDDKENDKLIFFQCPKKRVRFDESKNEIWTIDRYDDKENDKLIFFQSPKKRVRFDESANQIWTIDRYDDKENDNLIFQPPKNRVRFDESANEIWTIDRYDDKENDNLIFQPPKNRVRFDESANEIWTIDRYDDKENERCGLNIGFSDDGNFQSAEMKIMHSNDDEGSSSITSDIPAKNEKVDSTYPHISCDEDTGRKNRTRRKAILKAVGKFSRCLSENFRRRIVNGFSRLFSCSLGQQRNANCLHF